MRRNKIRWSVCLVLLLVALFTAYALTTRGSSEQSSGADWPMWRCDANRSAATPLELASDLHLQWVRQYPPLEPAWPDEPRMRFDVCYQPVVKGKMMFVNSPRSDSVFALDTDSGAAKWRFYTDGPVRFAPMAWRDKVYFVSDDGYLYCLRAADRKVIWKFQGAPSDRKVLGNKRLISMWPARGAPVIADGKIYFAAGIWPFMGVFIYCLDAETGQVVWENTGTGAMYINQPHSSPAFAGVAPQGYLVVAEDKLLVSGGRSVPACFDRRTGKFLYYRLAENQHIGHSSVSMTGDYFFNSGYMYDATTGDRLAGVSSEPVSDLSEAAIYGVAEDTIAASEVGDGSIKWSSAVSAERVWLKAGSRLYASEDNLVMAVDLPQSDGEPRVSWQAQIAGTPAAMLAADDKLFIVTLEGHIYCFGPHPTEPTIHTVEHRKSPPAFDEFTRKAKYIIKKTGATEGYCLVWGADNGRLVEELARQSDLQIIVVDPDKDRIEALRTSLDEAGLYGARIAAHVGDPLSFPFPPYLADLIVVESLHPAGSISGKTLVERLFRPLRPYGGVACFPVPADKQEDFAKSVATADVANTEVSRIDDLALLKRVGALPGSADWTHNYADAANTCVSQDELVKAPLGLLWFGGSSNTTILPRHGHGPPEQVVDGRLFIEGPHTMRAMDVYTGRMLWEVALPGIGVAYDNTSHEPGASSVGSNYVSSSEAIYVAYGQSCLLLDPATGKQISQFKLPAEPGAEETPTWGHLAIWEDLLIAGSSPIIFFGEERIGLQGNWDATSSKQLVAMNRHTGKVLWTFDSNLAFRHNAIAIGAGKVFCIDRLPDPVVARMNRRGETPEGTPRLTCLDVHTGKVLWDTTKDVFGTWLGYSEEHDILLQAGRPSRDMLPDERGDRMIVYRGKDGKVLWDRPHKYSGPCLLHGDTIITQGIDLLMNPLVEQTNACSLLTGEQVMRKSPITGAEAPWQFVRNYGCNTVVASQHLLTFRSAAAGYFDLANDGGTGNLGGFKSGCTSNLIVANGVLNAPDYTRTCVCSYQNQTSLAFVHMPEVEMWTFNTFSLGDEPVNRLGINFGAPGDRRDDDGMLWLDYPSVGGPSPDIPIQITSQQPEWFIRHSSRVGGDGLKWVGASGARGLTSFSITLDKKAEEDRLYTVALYFIEPDEVKPGARVFDVALQGRRVLEDFDIIAEARRTNHMIVREFEGISVRGDLTVTLTPSASAKTRDTVLCGIAVATYNSD